MERHYASLNVPSGCVIKNSMPYAEMIPHPDGEWVKHKDSAAELTRLRAALDAAETRAQEAILDAIVAQGQAEESHEARLKAEAERDAAWAKALQIANDEAARSDGEGPEALAAHATALRIAAALASFTKGSDGTTS